MPNFQTGAEHRLYLAYDSSTNTPEVVNDIITTGGTSSGGGSQNINDIHTNVGTVGFLLADQIKDVTVGGSNNTVDVTTRATARQGFSASIIATSDGTMSVQFAYEPRSTSDATYGTVNRVDLELLYYCFLTKSSIFAIDLDAAMDVATPGNTTTGAQGLGANWTIGFSQPKEVQGQVVLDVEFTLESYAQIVYFDGTDFAAIVDP